MNTEIIIRLIRSRITNPVYFCILDSGIEFQPRGGGESIVQVKEIIVSQ